MRRLLVGFLVFCALLVGQAAPATAIHDHDLGKWISAPNVAWDGQYAGNIQDAAYYWQDRGFDGYRPPLPQWSHGGSACATIWQGWINVCTVSRPIVHAYCGKVCDGWTQVEWFPNAAITGAYVLIPDDLNPYRRQQVWRHEWGHTLGLGHPAAWETTCVMQEFANVALGETCKHDRDALNAMYPGKRF